MSKKRAPFVVVSFIDDYKQRKWAEASGGELEFRTLSREAALLVMLLVPFGGRADAILIRYLNDGAGLLRVVRRLVLETLILLLARLRRRKIMWLAHNVDAESESNHPRVTRARRRVVGHFATDVYVTEELLVPHAKALLPIPPSVPVSACTFGPIDDALRRDYSKDSAHAELLSAIPRGKRFYIVSSNNWTPKKARELDLLIRLADIAQQADARVHFVVCGPQVRQVQKRAPSLYARLCSRDNLSLLPGWVEMRDLVTQGLCDAVIKNHGDLSMSLGFLHACTLQIPVIAEAGTFSAALIQRYGTGVVLTPDTLDFDRLVDHCRALRGVPQPYQLFFSHNSWRRGAAALLHREGAH